MKHYLTLNLNLFDGEGGSSGEGTSVDAAQNTGDYSSVKFGVQTDEGETDDATVDAEPEGVTTTSNTLEERRKAYNDLINSDEYKEFYTEDTQKMINRRFKETKNLEKQVAEFKPLLDILTQMYGVSDVEGVKRAIENDNSIWESRAFESGMDVEQYKKIQRLERENKALHDAQMNFLEHQRVDNQVNAWLNEAEELKSEYPDFDFDTELQDPEFARMLQSGVPVRHAYEVKHMDEIKNSIVQYSTRQTAKAVTDNIRAKGSRPLENGTSAQGAFTVKSDVTKLTKADREEIARRVARGEHISF